ncbi:unnamed protein product [Caretta caretta]
MKLQPCNPVSIACMFQDGTWHGPGLHRPAAAGSGCGMASVPAFLLPLVGVSCAGSGLLLAWGESQGPGTEPQPGRAGRAALPAPAAEPAPGAPPRPLEEVEIPELGPGSWVHPCCGDRLSLGAGRVPAAGSCMKTFRGSRSSPGSAPRPGGGQSSLVFVSNEEWGQRNC